VIRHAAAKRLRALPGTDVASVAIRIRCSKRIVVADMAIGAGDDFSGRLQLMRARQWPARRAVIENRRIPGDGVMARRAIGSHKRRPGVWVDRVVGLLPGRQMTLRIPAVGGGNCQGVVVVDVAIGAGHNLSGWCELV
jgi:hypothetical protein